MLSRDETERQAHLPSQREAGPAVRTFWKLCHLPLHPWIDPGGFLSNGKLKGDGDVFVHPDPLNTEVPHHLQLPLISSRGQLRAKHQLTTQEKK